MAGCSAREAFARSTPPGTRCHIVKIGTTLLSKDRRQPRHFERGMFTSLTPLLASTFCLVPAEPVPPDMRVRIGNTKIRMNLESSEAEESLQSIAIDNLAL